MRFQSRWWLVSPETGKTHCFTKPTLSVWSAFLSTQDGKQPRNPPPGSRPFERGSSRNSRKYCPQRRDGPSEERMENEDVRWGKAPWEEFRWGILLVVYRTGELSGWGQGKAQDGWDARIHCPSKLTCLYVFIPTNIYWAPVTRQTLGSKDININNVYLSLNMHSLVRKHS